MTSYDPFRASSGKTNTEDVKPVEPEKPKAPTGTKNEILDWVGGDKERAQISLDAEKAKDNPRSTVVKALEEIVG